MKATPTKTFNQKLDQAVQEIKERAKGITCKDCPHATFYPGGTGYCHKATNIFGEFLHTSERAPACEHHPELKKLLANSETR